MSAKYLLWVGSVVIFLSIVLQFIGAILSSLPLALVGLGLNGVSVPLTIWQAYRSAIEEQRRFEQERRAREAQDQYVYDRTPEGRQRRNIEQLRNEMHMDE